MLVFAIHPYESNGPTRKFLFNEIIGKSLSLFIYLNWRIITLQYCAGFCHISVWISYRHTFVPSILYPLLPPSPLHPSRLSQNTSFGYLVSYIKLPLAICFTYGNIYISVLFYQIIPPSPPRVQKSVLYLCVSFAALHIGSLHFYRIYCMRLKTSI